jgi:hypothetical protein
MKQETSTVNIFLYLKRDPITGSFKFVFLSSPFGHMIQYLYKALGYTWGGTYEYYDNYIRC